MPYCVEQGKDRQWKTKRSRERFGVGKYLTWQSGLVFQNDCVSETVGVRTDAIRRTIGGTADFVNNYAYDLLGEMFQVTQSGVTGGNAVAEKRVDFGYSSVGQLGSVTRYADLAGTELVATGSYGYDQFGQLTSLDYSQGQTTLVNHGWSYDADGNVTQYVNSIDGTADYGYDATGQLLSASYSTSGHCPAQRVLYLRRQRQPADDRGRHVHDRHGQRGHRPTARTRTPTTPTATAPAAPALPTAR